MVTSRRTIPVPLVALVCLSVLGLAVRLVAARSLGFGDSEALYACYALHPQPAYVDHPGLIGLIARVLGGGTAPTPARAHMITAVAASVAPWLVIPVARAFGAKLPRAAWAALAVAVVPEISVGLFAMTPDLPLFFAWLGSLGFAAFGLSAEASTTRAAGSLVVAGLLAGVACAAKATGVALVLALILTYLSRGARPHAKSVWPWLGLASGLVVVAPILWFEARCGWPMLRHRLVDTQQQAGLSFRNAAGILFGQALYLSPVVATAAAIAGWDAWKRRRDDALSRLVSNATFVPLAFLVPLCLWSRVAEPHWLAPALLALPAHVARRPPLISKRLSAWCLGTAAVCSFAVHAWVLSPRPLAPASLDPRLDLSNELFGWPDVVAAVHELAEDASVPGTEPGAIAVVGPHWVVCAQLHAALRNTLPVGCADPVRDDFDDWMPRSRWNAADTLLFVTDNRFDSDPLELFPQHVAIRETRLTLTRDGRTARVFRLVVLERRAEG